MRTVIYTSHDFYIRLLILFDAALRDVLLATLCTHALVTLPFSLLQ